VNIEQIEEGQRVRVIDQEIFGTVARVHCVTNEVVIIDDDAPSTEDEELVFRPRELELL